MQPESEPAALLASEPDQETPTAQLYEDSPPRNDLDSPTASPDVQRVERADRVRHEALRAILLLFAAVIVYGGVGAMLGGTIWTNVKEFLQLVGLVIGYYFGRGQML